jgi:hypothetical protein
MTHYPAAFWLPVPNHGGPMTAHLGLVLHVQQGNNGLQGWFSNPASGASSTWWVSKTGRVEQYVDADLQAWAQAAGNATYNSVETEGYDSEPLTAAQVDALAGLYTWGATVYGWPLVLAETPGAEGFAWHGMGGSAWGAHPACPGDLRRDQRTEILLQAAGDDDTMTAQDKQDIIDGVLAGMRHLFAPDQELYNRGIQFSNTSTEQNARNFIAWAEQGARQAG